MCCQYSLIGNHQLQQRALGNRRVCGDARFNAHVTKYLWLVPLDAQPAFLHRVPYTCQRIAEIAELAFLAFIRIRKFRVWCRHFFFDPHLQHQRIHCKRNRDEIRADDAHLTSEP